MGAPSHKFLTITWDVENSTLLRCISSDSTHRAASVLHHT